MSYIEKSEFAGQLIGSKVIDQYIRGGKGAVTLKSPSGKHYSYQFRYPVKEQRGEFPRGTMFVYVLVGHRTWQYVGMLKSDRKLHHTRASKFSVDSEIFKGARYIVKMMNFDFDTPMTLMHQGVCSVCGRKLTSPKSIPLGIGPRCLKNLAVDNDTVDE